MADKTSMQKYINEEDLAKPIDPLKLDFSYTYFPLYLPNLPKFSKSCIVDGLLDDPKPAAPDMSRYPHKCDCGAPAYRGFDSIECSNPNCQHHR